MQADEKATIAAHVMAGWSAGTIGKGLLVRAHDRQPQLEAWRTLIWGGPHHLQVVEALGLAADDVAASFGIAADGTLELYDPQAALLEELLALDRRFRAPMPGWSWSFE
jgi:hypothetical protein